MSTASLPFFIERGTGPPLLLIHGLMVTGEMYEPVLDHFAARHRVIVPDLRGHGRSRGLPPPFTVPQLAADLAALLDHLGVESAAVLGYSQGGAVAQQLALAAPARCSRLVLACTYAFNMASLRERMEGYAAPLLIRAMGMERFSRFVFSSGVDGLGDPRKAWLAGLIAAQDPALMIASWRAAMAYDSRPLLPSIRCPTLVVAGSRDTAVPIHHARTLHDGIPGARLTLIEGGGHGLIWTHTLSFVRAVDRFLDEEGATPDPPGSA
ncbi:MAG: alpha/beta fold hydrolase [Alphaproteobacteria bacterium]|nr:alpha/beta fold hydrolase [Alphaproteobacteria bacterium]